MTDTRLEVLEFDAEAEERLRLTHESYKRYEKERKNRHYKKQKTIGHHRTLLIPFDLDQRLRNEATKRQVSIVEMVKLCLTTSLNLWK